jgi:hypothetical protein
VSVFKSGRSDRESLAFTGGTPLAHSSSEMLARMLGIPSSLAFISNSAKMSSILDAERGIGENVNIIFIQMHAEF